jgi:hypothetical protein
MTVEPPGVPGAISVGSLALVVDPANGDPNEDTVGHDTPCDIVADGSDALKAVLEGLRLRLANPVVPNETLSLEGGDRDR